MEFLKKSFFIVVLLFFFSSILIKVDAENNEDITPERLLFDSKVFFKQKDIPACINNLKMIINRFPDSLEVEEAYFMLGDCYNSDIKFYQDLDAAREAYQAALDRYSDSLLKEETYLKLASVYEKTGNLLEASLLLDKIVREFPNIKNIQKVKLDLAEYEYTLGNPKDALPKFSELIKEYPDALYVKKVFFRIGDCYFMLQDYQSALEYYQTALNKYPDYINGIHNLLFRIAETNYEMDRFDEALELFMKYNNYFPKMESAPDALMRIGDCFYFKNDYKRAIFFYREVENRFPDSKAAYLSQINKIGIEVKLNPKERHDFKKLIALTDKTDPSDPQVAIINYRIADILYLNGFPEEAYNVVIKSLEFGVDKDIESKCFALRLKAMEEIIVRFSREKQFRKIVSFFVKDRSKFFRYDYTPEIYYHLSNALFLLGSYSDARNYLLLIPSAEMTKEHYIWLELRVNDALGSSQNVITAGEKLQRLFPQSKAIIQSCFMLGHAYYKEGKYDKSVITFDKYMTLSGKNAEPLAYFYIGMAYYKIKNYKKALNFLLKAKDVISKTGKDKKGDADKLVENIKVCIEELTLTFADSYYYLEKYILALQTYLDYLQRFPKSDNIPYVLYQLGYIYLKLKEVEKAEKYFNDLMKDYKGNFWSEQAKFIFENEKIKMNFANQRK